MSDPDPYYDEYGKNNNIKKGLLHGGEPRPSDGEIAARFEELKKEHVLLLRAWPETRDYLYERGWVPSVIPCGVAYLDGGRARATIPLISPGGTRVWVVLDDDGRGTITSWSWR